MNDLKLIEIGYIAKAHGLKGEVLLKVHDGDDEYLKVGLKVFLNEELFSIETLRRPKDGVLLKLEGVADRNQSELLKGKSVSVDSSVFSENLKEDEVYLNQLIGFGVHLKGKFMGEVSGFSETEAHDLLKVKLEEGGVVELPYVDQFISEINKIEKTIKVDCPDELFDFSFFNEAKK